MKLKKLLCYVVVFAMLLSCMSITSMAVKEDNTDYLTFSSDKAFTVKLTKKENCSASYSLEYSLDKVKWAEWKDADNEEDCDGIYEAKAYKNDENKYVIYFRNKEGSVNSAFSSYASDQYTSSFSFVNDGEGELKVAASGNIMTLLDYKNPDTVKMGDYAFAYMFKGCSSLTTAPKLPAETLSRSCYLAMFDGCSFLTKAPELNSTNLAEYCYRDMFYKCTSLVEAPDLLAEKLPKQCYGYMFYGCESLLKAPELNISEINGNSCSYMFYGCKHLFVEELKDSTQATWSIPSSEEETPVDKMVSGTAAGGATVEIPESENTNYYKVSRTYSLSSKSSLESQGGVIFKIGETEVSEAPAGIAVTAKAKAVTGYSGVLSGVYGEESTALTINTNGTFIMPEDDSTITATYGPHAHDLTFKISEDGKTLEASCSADGCTWETNPMLTITAENMVCTGEPYEGVSLTPLCVGVEETKFMQSVACGELSKIEYYSGDTKLKEAPSEPGEYIAKVTYTKDSKTYTISDDFKIIGLCSYEKECTIDNGTFNLTLGGNEYGLVKIIKSGTGWVIYSEDEQKYIYWDGSDVKYSDTAYVWSYNNGFYITKSTETKVFFWTFTKKKNYYLSFDGNNLSVSECSVLAKLTQSIEGDKHNYVYKDNGNGTHTYYCTNCNEIVEENTPCDYESSGLCKQCGHLNPENVSFTVDVNVTSKTTKPSGWMRFFCKGSKITYTAKINATCTGDELKSVEYSVDNVNYKEGMTYSSSSEITSLYVRVTAANGASYIYHYTEN